MDFILLAKSIHVVGWVSWFAGLFFLGRLLVNHAEADSRPEPERTVLHTEYAGMESRLTKIILRPAMGLTWVAGIVMLVLNPGYLSSGTPGWMWTKLALIILLSGYNDGTTARIMKPMQRGERPLSSWQLRLWNEVPTFFLVAIVFTAVYGKVGQLNYWYLAAAVAAFALVVWRGARAYAKKREG